MSPRTKAQFEEIRFQSKEAIKRAALDLFSEKGFAATSISQIAERAGISKGLMYNYFKSKTQLLQELLSELTHTSEEILRNSLQLEKDPPAQLRFIIMGLAGLVASDLPRWKLITSVSFQPGALEGMEGFIQEKKAINLEIMLPLFGRLGAQNPMYETLLLGAALDGIFLQYLFAGDQYPLNDMLELMLQRYSPK